MAIAHDTSTSFSLSDQSSNSGSVTIADQPNRLLLVAVQGGNLSAPSDVTVGGSSIVSNLLASVTAGVFDVYVYAKVAPGTGSQTVAVTYGGAVYANVSIVSLYGVAQSDYLADSATAYDDTEAVNPATLSIGSASTETVVDFICSDLTEGITCNSQTNRTERLNYADAMRSGASTVLPGYASVTCDWATNYVKWGMVAVSLTEASVDSVLAGLTDGGLLVGLVDGGFAR